MPKKESKIESYFPFNAQAHGANDFVLWEDFKNGNRDSFTKIYNKYVYNLYSYGYKIANDKVLVEDCIHDLFIELWDKRENLGSTTSIKFYLFKGLKRKIVRNLNKQSVLNTDQIGDQYTFSISFSHETNLIFQQLDHDRKEILINSLQKLSKREKEVIYLRFYDNLSYEEIAELMSITVKTAYNSVHNAIGHLRESLSHKAGILLFVTSMLALIGYFLSF